jgi:hypothetical protein
VGATHGKDNKPFWQPRGVEVHRGSHGYSYCARFMNQKFLEYEIKNIIHENLLHIILMFYFAFQSTFIE